QVEIRELLKAKKMKTDWRQEEKEACRRRKLSIGIATGHYRRFISKTLNKMVKHEYFLSYLSYCLLMNKSPIHKPVVIRKLIKSRGYMCAYLPP
ncbi:uncharacterized protein BX663DRAFT_411331, partial [Cokeromyces recurvatus]|uniref:uncharacterized protein n=1 Tax=Cokeromyces recurvatus TaxID=90255 RepID=UPI00221E9A89